MLLESISLATNTKVYFYLHIQYNPSAYVFTEVNEKS